MLGTASTMTYFFLAPARPRGQGQHVTSLVQRFIADRFYSFLRKGIVLLLLPSLFNIMPRPRKYSIEEVLNFTVKDI